MVGFYEVLTFVATCGYIMRMKTTVSVRDGKNRFSELIKRAAAGEEITITSYGHACARLSKAKPEAHIFKADWKWLESMPLTDEKTSSDQIIREDRDGRD